MESELELARAKVADLKAELEQERRAHKKTESANKKLVRELSEGRKGWEALEQLCEELATEVSSYKAEMARMRKDMEEERKMLRMSEILRKERVQMKLAEANLVLEEKLSEFEWDASSKCCKEEATIEKQGKQTKTAAAASNSCASPSNRSSSASGGNMKSYVPLEKSASNHPDTCLSSNNNSVPSQRRAFPEPENPHIKRGIKGFVEFPKVVRAIGAKSRNLGTKLECQKAQLRILLKQKSPIGSTTNLIATS